MCKHEEWVHIGTNEFGRWENCTSCQTTRLVPNKKTAELLEGYKKDDKVLPQKLKFSEKNTVKVVINKPGDGP